MRDGFIEKITDIKEKDYGDFKRKAGQYLNKLQQQLQKDHLDTYFDEIRCEVIFTPSEDVESAREKIISWAESLKI